MEFRPFRIFLSSTFRDMMEERDILRDKSLPELRSLTKELFVDPRLIDLRQGAKLHDLDEEAEREAEVLNVCHQAIEHSSSFICCIGDRYGHVPELNVRDGLQEVAPSGSSVTEFEIRLAFALRHLSENSRFYIREMVYGDMPESKRCLFDERFAHADRSVGEARYEKLQELIGWIRSEVPAERIFDYKTAWRNGRIEGIDALHKKFRDDCHEDAVRFQQSLEGQSKEFVTVKVVRSAFLNRCKNFVDYADLCKEIVQQAGSQLGQDLSRVLFVANGRGASSTLGAIFRELESDHEVIVLSHLAQADGMDCSTRRMLTHWLTQLAAGDSRPRLPPGADLATVNDALAQSLRRIPDGYRIVVVIDDIDQLDTALGRTVQFIPDDLLHRVSLVFSCRDSGYRRVLRAKHIDLKLVEIPPLTRDSAVLVASTFTRREYGRAVDDKVLSEILSVSHIDAAEHEIITEMKAPLFEVMSERFILDLETRLERELLACERTAIECSVRSETRTRLLSRFRNQLEKNPEEWLKTVLRIESGELAAYCYEEISWLLGCVRNINLLSAKDYERAHLEFEHLPEHKRLARYLLARAQALSPDRMINFSARVERTEDLYGNGFVANILSLLSSSKAKWSPLQIEQAYQEAWPNAHWDSLAFQGLQYSLVDVLDLDEQDNLFIRDSEVSNFFRQRYLPIPAQPPGVRIDESEQADDDWFEPLPSDPKDLLVELERRRAQEEPGRSKLPPEYETALQEHREAIEQSERHRIERIVLTHLLARDSIDCHAILPLAYEIKDADALIQILGRSEEHGSLSPHPAVGAFRNEVSRHISEGSQTGPVYQMRNGEPEEVDPAIAACDLHPFLLWLRRVMLDRSHPWKERRVIANFIPWQLQSLSEVGAVHSAALVHLLEMANGSFFDAVKSEEQSFVIWDEICHLKRILMLAMLHRAAGRWKFAKRAAEAGLSISEALIEDEPETEEGIRSLVRGFQRVLEEYSLDHTESARSVGRESLEDPVRSTDDAQRARVRAYFLNEAGRSTEAKALLSNAQRWLQSQTQNEGGEGALDALDAERMAVDAELILMDMCLDNPEESIGMLDALLEKVRKLRSSYPENDSYTVLEMGVLRKLGTAYLAKKNVPAALVFHRKVHEYLSKLIERFPNNISYHQARTSLLCESVVAVLDHEGPEKAKTFERWAWAACDAWTSLDPGSQKARISRTTLSCLSADILFAQGKISEAAELFDSTSRELEEFAEDLGDVNDLFANHFIMFEVNYYIFLEKAGFKERAERQKGRIRQRALFFQERGIETSEYVAGLFAAIREDDRREALWEDLPAGVRHGPMTLHENGDISLNAMRIPLGEELHNVRCANARISMSSGEDSHLIVRVKRREYRYRYRSGKWQYFNRRGCMGPAISACVVAAIFWFVLVCARQNFTLL